MRAEPASATGIDPRRPRLLNLRVPIIAAAWVIGYSVSYASPRTGTAWLALAEWGVSHGFGDLARSSEYVTIAVAFVALLGALLRVVTVPQRSPAKSAGLLAVCAPWCVLLPAESAGFYVLAVAAISLAGFVGPSPPLTAPDRSLWRRVVRECFPVLSAACFVTMSWQYNALRLLQCLLIAAGLSLVVRAALPAQAEMRLRVSPDAAEESQGTV